MSRKKVTAAELALLQIMAAKQDLEKAKGVLESTERELQDLVGELRSEQPGRNTTAASEALKRKREEKKKDKQAGK